MDFSLSEEQRMILEYGPKLAQTYDRAYWIAKAEKSEFVTEMWQQVGSDGFLGMMVGEEYGGAGLGMFEMALLMESVSRQGTPLLNLVVGPTMSLGLIDQYGTEDQKKFYLPEGCSGKKIFCFAITEPTAGSNSMKITSVAKADGDGFRLNGSKTFITGADVSDYALVVARTTPFDQAGHKTEGFTLFMVDMKAEGVSLGEIPTGVIAPESQWNIFFDDVKLGREHVIGEIDQGFKILFDTLNPERICLAAMCVGIGHYVLEKAVAYASDRVVFNGPIGAYQGIAHPLAEARTEIEMAGLMTYKAAWQFDAREPAGAASNMAKYYAAEASIKAVDIAVQTHGGNGFTKEYGIFDLHGVVRLMKTAPLNREMILNYIGEHVMGLPRSY